MKNEKQTSLPVAVPLLLCFLFAGCLGPKPGCRISVANACDRDIASVQVRDKAGNIYTFDDLPKHSVGTFQQAKADIGDEVTLEVTGKDDKPVTTTVRLDRPVGRMFDGRVLFQLEKQGKVRTFIMPRPEGAGKGDIPWAQPPSWQGVTGVPGFSGSE